MRRLLRIPYIWLLLSPYLLIAVGIFLNTLAITVNQGYMPVAKSAIVFNNIGNFPAPGTVIDEIHRVMQSSDHLKILCDWIQVPRESVMSIGDAFLRLGIWFNGWSFVAWLALLWRGDFDRTL
jgi:hypothetical protein